MRLSKPLSVAGNISIVMSYELTYKIQYLMQRNKHEWQWFHTVERRKSDDGTIEYHLDNLVIPEQLVSGNEVDSDPQRYAKIYKELKEQFGDDRTEINRVIQNLGCWCHSHVNMSCNPSKQDEEQFKENIEFGQQNNPRPEIMIILNKKGEMFSRVYDPDMGLTFENVPVRVEHNIDVSDCIKALKSKIKEAPKKKPEAPRGKVYTPGSPGSQKTSSTGKGGLIDLSRQRNGSGMSAISNALREGVNSHGMISKKKTDSSFSRIQTAEELFVDTEGSDRDEDLIRLIQRSNKVNSRPLASDIMDLIVDVVPEDYMQMFYAMMFCKDQVVRGTITTLFEDEPDTDRVWLEETRKRIQNGKINPPELVLAVENFFLDIKGAKANADEAEYVEALLDSFLYERAELLELFQGVARA